MIVMQVSSFLLHLLGVGFSATGQVWPPSPPKTYTEVLGVTARQHVLIPRCGTTRNRLEWSFDGRTARLTKLQIHGRRFRVSDLAEVNSQIARFADDVLVRVDCNAQAAVIAFIQSQAAGSEAAKQVRYSVEDNRLVLEETINTD